ncbi:hypothetical protein L873DRAFT_818599 [Choiromyces venosus 120613-1]|uniref:Uncharacterized protein n=1 Tax=Choiromyces venosus 120613-1 TaxID=1336337 RepID=A0A3N4IRQ9_9PEZI|nr:hypothetical protein L873DRAFT_818599 [Choiromyces venosus 120613-1]
MLNTPVTHTHTDTFIVTPIKTYELGIVCDIITCAALQLEFEQIMLRQPHTGEGDMIFGMQELKEWATNLWLSTQ